MLECVDCKDETVAKRQWREPQLQPQPQDVLGSLPMAMRWESSAHLSAGPAGAPASLRKAKRRSSLPTNAMLRLRIKGAASNWAGLHEHGKRGCRVEDARLPV